MGWEIWYILLGTPLNTSKFSPPFNQNAVLTHHISCLIRHNFILEKCSPNITLHLNTKYKILNFQKYLANYRVCIITYSNL